MLSYVVFVPLRDRASGFVRKTPGVCIATMSISCRAHVNHAVRTAVAICVHRARPVFKTETAASLSQAITTRWPFRMSTKYLKAAVAFVSSNTEMHGRSDLVLDWSMTFASNGVE